QGPDAKTTVKLFAPGSDSADKRVKCKDAYPGYYKINCHINFKPEAGLWKIRIKTTSTASGRISATVTAMSTIKLSEGSTIELNGHLDKPSILFDRPRLDDELAKEQIIVATLSYGPYAVIGAQVTALITSDRGGYWEIELKDNGDALEKSGA